MTARELAPPTLAVGGERRMAAHRSSPDPDSAVVVEGITKRYGSRAAVHDLSFAIPRGTVAGLIGPNGAGKTTLMAMLLGLVHPTSGTGTVLGEPLDQPARYLRQCRASTTSAPSPCSVTGHKATSRS
jgi:ABC-2 type transport system ATP-binding protein